ncbi:MAG: tetratricopeptide repeat protein [Elusimicrobia bacterium]|nr:tetratricopeptide repeat protein [Elusimicrobiota bacterium]
MNLLMASLLMSLPLRAQGEVPPPKADAAKVQDESGAQDKPGPVAQGDPTRPSAASPGTAGSGTAPAAVRESAEERAAAKAVEEEGWKPKMPGKPVPAELQGVPEQKAEEKAVEKAPEKAAEAPKAKADKSAAELAFLKAILEDKDAKAIPEAVEEAVSLAGRNADGQVGAEARLLAAQLLQKGKEWKAAVVAYLSFLYEYPDADEASRAKRDYMGIVEKRMSRKSREALGGLVRVPDKPGKAERLSAMLRSLVETAGEELYEPIAEEFESFGERFPAYFETDKVQMALADLHTKASKYDEALHVLRRLAAVYPESGQVAQAQWNVAVLYADHLKKYDRAVEAFQDLAKRYPKTPIVMPSLERTAALLEERIKDFPSAADAYERIAKLYPRTEGALKALQSQARLQRDRLKQHQDAVATFKRVAEDFGAPAAVEALKEAAVVARKNLKDFGQEAELKKLLATKFPDAADAPEALFSVGEIYEGDLKDDAKAKEAFQQVASKYPTHRLAKKAQERVGKIDARSGQ